MQRLPIRQRLATRRRRAAILLPLQRRSRRRARRRTQRPPVHRQRQKRPRVRQQRHLRLHLQQNRRQRPLRLRPQRPHQRLRRRQRRQPRAARRLRVPTLQRRNPAARSGSTPAPASITRAVNGTARPSKGNSCPKQTPRRQDTRRLRRSRQQLNRGEGRIPPSGFGEAQRATSGREGNSSRWSE